MATGNRETSGRGIGRGNGREIRRGSGRRATVETMERRSLFDGQGWALGPGAESAPEADGGALLVNDEVVSEQFAGDVAMNRHGEFVVAYEQPTTVAPGRLGPGDVFVRVYDRKGRPTGEPIQASVGARSASLQPTVAIDHRGNFVVAWVGVTDPTVTVPEIFARRFDRRGNALGGEFQVNTFVLGFHASPDVATDPAGNFVITWTQFPGRGQQVSQDGSGAGVFGRRFDRHGLPIGGEFGLSAATAGAQDNSSVASTADGEFVVSFTSPDGAGSGAFARRFGADGAPAGNEFPVNQHTAGNQLAGGVAADRDGNFAVPFSGAGPESDGGGIYVRLFDAGGAATTPQRRASPVGAMLESDPAIAMDRRGNFAVTWGSRQVAPPPATPLDWGVFGQLFDPRGDAHGDAFRAGTPDTLPLTNGGVGLSDHGDLALAYSIRGQDAPDSWGTYVQRFEFHPVAPSLHDDDRDDA